MKKRLLLIVVLFICFVLSGCTNNSYNQEEIDKIGNIINGN